MLAVLRTLDCEWIFGRAQKATYEESGRASHGQEGEEGGLNSESMTLHQLQKGLGVAQVVDSRIRLN